jgi:hypothetical protein
MVSQLAGKSLPQAGRFLANWQEASGLGGAEQFLRVPSLRQEGKGIRGLLVVLT